MGAEEERYQSYVSTSPFVHGPLDLELTEHWGTF